MDYIEKMQELLSSGYSHQEVAENLYLNYHSIIDTDEVYKIRKKIASAYECNINDVKLIGSAHTGYTYKEDGSGSKEKKLLKREDPKDYDFAIISPDVFIKYFHKVDLVKIKGYHKRPYIDSILKGKLHILHANGALKSELEGINRSIMDDLGIERHITVCFYLSEKNFIDGLVTYNTELYTGELKRIREEKQVIDAVDSMEIKAIDKLEG